MIEHIEQGTLAPNIRACIALTSWKKRINTVGLTIYNLFETCGPDYHIVLTLAEEEFPKKEQELPRDLVLMNRDGVFEILWVKKNYKSFKKWFFCSVRYPKVPIITADDDFIYTWNYAQKLYGRYRAKHACVACTTSHKLGKLWPHGYAVLYPPRCFSISNDSIEKILSILTDAKCNHDDGLWGRLYYMNSANAMVETLNLQWPDVCIIHSKYTLLNGISSSITRSRALDEEDFVEHLLKIWRDK